MRRLRIVIAGGSGQVGKLLLRHFAPEGHEIHVLTRRQQGQPNEVLWNGRSLGPWREALEGTDVVINLAGRSVNCRYTPAHRQEMLESRLDSTRALGMAIEACRLPPWLWLQASTATIYAHRFDAPNDERHGIIGGNEPGAPAKWNASVEIAQAWERALEESSTPRTRKVAMRAAMVMSSDRGGIFDVMATLARRGLGGTAGTGSQFVSWIQEDDFAEAIRFLIAHEELEGPVNLSSPNPLPNREFFRILRRAVGAKIGPPVPRILLEIGAWMMGTETELLLKSRRVVPERLLQAGFRPKYPDWSAAAPELVSRWHG